VKREGNVMKEMDMQISKLQDPRSREVPSSKFQILNKQQHPNPKSHFASSGSWDLELFWILVLGSWIFEARP